MASSVLSIRSTVLGGMLDFSAMSCKRMALAESAMMSTSFMVFSTDWFSLESFSSILTNPLLHNEIDLLA